MDIIIILEMVEAQIFMLKASTNKNGVPSSVYKNLIAQVHKDIAPLHKYMNVRKKALNKDKLNMYDLYVPSFSYTSIHREFKPFS